MNEFFATKEVKKIVDSKDNIIDQLKELSKHSYMKGVRRFIDMVINANMRYQDKDSKYILYCVVKYYYQLDVVRKEKFNYTTSLPNYSLSDTYDYDFVQSLVTSKDNIIDQCKLLRQYRNSKDVQEYIAILQKENDEFYESDEYDYVIYCINKYYYGRKVPKLKQPVPTFRLYAYIKGKPTIEEPIDIFTALEDIKKGDKIKILNGAFHDLIGIITEINLKNDEYDVRLNIYGEDTVITLDAQYTKFIKIDDESES